tara:strand:+ start:111 stop:461 length:351 start_codon:yes stop_codon:yes gene_type:complete
MNKPKLHIGDIINDKKPFLLFLKNEMCSYCKALIPAVEVLKSRYGRELGFYFLDVNEQKEFVELFEKDINGVPTVFLFYKEKYVVLDDPETPDPYMWYTLSYLDDFIKRFLGGKDA